MFINPNGITTGLYYPLVVLNAAWCLSSGLIKTLLYPDQISNVENRFMPSRSSTMVLISGSGELLGIVHAFMGQ